MEAVLPKSVNYLDTLPKAVPSERKRKNFFAANGTQYRPGQTMIIEVSDGRAFLDPHNSFLRFTVTNQGANNMVPELGGGQAFIRNFRVQQNGNTIMNIQAYNRLYCGIIAPTTGGNQLRAATSVMRMLLVMGHKLVPQQLLMSLHRSLNLMVVTLHHLMCLHLIILWRLWNSVSRL